MAKFLEYEDEYENEFFEILHFDLSDVLLLGTVLVCDRADNRTFKALVELGIGSRHFEADRAAEIWEAFGSADEAQEIIGLCLDAIPYTGRAELYHAAKPYADEVKEAISAGLADLKGGADQGEVVKRFLEAVREITPSHFALEVQPLPKHLEQEPPPSDFILDGCFESGDKAELIAPSKFGKSFWATGLALHIAAGRPYCGMTIPRARAVLYVNLEIKADWFARRIKGLLAAYGFDEAPAKLRIWNARGIGEEVRDHLVSVVRKTRPKLVIIDPLYKLLRPGENENSNEGMREILALEDAVAEAGAAVLVVEHDAKGAVGARDAVDRGAGTGWTARDCDCRILLTPHAEGDEYAHFEVLSRNTKARAPVTLRVGDGHSFFIDKDTPAQAVKGKGSKSRPSSDYAERARAWFGRQGRAVSRIAAARDFGKEVKISRDAALNVFDGLVADGVLAEKNSHGRGGGRLVGLPSMFHGGDGGQLSRKFSETSES